MPGASSHRDLSRQHGKPQSSRDLIVYTSQELDQLRKSNATIKLTKKQAIKLFFWDSERRTVCYWTKQTWLFVMIFYPIFIAFVAGLFYGMMVVIIYWVKTNYENRPMINKASLTKQPTYV